VKIPAANRYAIFGLVVLALVALAGVASLSKPVTVSAGQQDTSRRVAPVSVSLRACPAPGSPGSHGTGVAMVAAGGGSGPGQAILTRLSAPAGTSPLASLSQPGTLSVAGVPAASAASPGIAGGSVTGGSSAAVVRPGGVMITAGGSMARGLAAAQTSAGGVVTAGCGSPGTDFWFAAPGQQAAGTISLQLMNVDNQASSVNVDILTDTGPLQTGIDTGITVPPHGLVVQSLAGLVHGSRAIGLHVRTSVGRVVAALRESTRQAAADGQWLPAAQAPSSSLVIPGLPSSHGPRELYVANPAAADAAVKLAVVSPGGTYQPTGTGAIVIPAGSASRIELPSLSGVTGAVVLTSRIPVTAAVIVPGGQSGAPGAQTAAAPALQEQGVVADAGQSATTTLVLSAPGPAAQARVSTGAAGLAAAGGAGAGSVRVVSVPAKHSVTVKVGRPAGLRPGSGFAVMITPLAGAGPLYAGWVAAQASGGVVSIIPVASALTWVPLPAVRDSVTRAAP
jgi:hypothetical protein